VKFHEKENAKRKLRMAEIYLMKADYKSAVQNANEALKILKELENPNVRSTANRKRKAKDTATAQ